MTIGYNSTLYIRSREHSRLKRKKRNFLREEPEIKLKNYHTIKTSILINGLALLLFQYAIEIGSMARDYVPI